MTKALIEEKLKALSAEFLRSSVTFRPGSVSKDKKTALPLAYIDARDVMDRLDSVLGGQNWQDRYEFHGSRTICYLSVKLGDKWITKADGAGDTNIEGEKGGISDALKRAAVKFGIGRYLYHLDFKWAPINEYKRFTSDFTSNPWAFLVKDGGSYGRAVEAAQKQITNIIKGEAVDAKVIGALQKRYPDLALALDMASEGVK